MIAEQSAGPKGVSENHSPRRWQARVGKAFARGRDGCGENVDQSIVDSGFNLTFCAGLLTPHIGLTESLDNSARCKETCGPERGMVGRPCHNVCMSVLRTWLCWRSQWSGCRIVERA